MKPVNNRVTVCIMKGSILAEMNSIINSIIFCSPLFSIKLSFLLKNLSIWKITCKSKGDPFFCTGWSKYETFITNETQRQSKTVSILYLV